MNLATSCAITMASILVASLPAHAGDGATTKPAFKPNPTLAELLADNTVMDLGVFNWERPEQGR